MQYLSHILEQQARWLERANNLPQGSVVGVYEDGEFRFYKFGVLAGRVPRSWAVQVIRTWEDIYNEQH